MVGVFSLEVCKARDLRKSLREETNPYCKVFLGQTEKQTRKVQNTENPEWNHKLDFPIARTTETLRIQVWDHQGGLDDMLGEMRIEVGGRHATGDRWLLLQPKPSGEIYLKWNYNLEASPKDITEDTPLAGEPAEEQEDRLGDMTLEVVNAKKLETADFAETVSAYLILRWGIQEHKTKVKHRNVNPYWNESFDFAVRSQTDMCLITAYDSEERDRIIGSAEFRPKIGDTLAKGSNWMQLKRSDATEPLGDIFIRFKYVPKKRVKGKVDATTKDHDEDDIDLGYVPKITGSTGVMPESRLYIWFQLFDDPSFGEQLQKKVLAHYTHRERVKDKPGLPPGPPQFADVQYANMDEVIEQAWKVRTRLSLFTKIRAAAQQLKVAGSVAITTEEEDKLRIKWKEFRLMMSDLTNSLKIEKSTKSLWNMFAYGVDDPSPEMRKHIEVRVNKKVYMTMCVHVLSAFLPGVSKKMIRKIAGEEWARSDEEVSGHVEESTVFVKFVKEIAAFWCETLTEYEYQTFLHTLLPYLLRARRECQRSLNAPRKRKKKKEGTKNPTPAPPAGPPGRTPRTSRKPGLDTSAPAPQKPEEELTGMQKLLATPLMAEKQQRSPRRRKASPRAPNSARGAPRPRPGAADQHSAAPSTARRPNSNEASGSGSGSVKLPPANAAKAF